MKTHILQLEPHDDIVSTRDKLAWAQAARVVLVWPAGEAVLNRRLDLLLLLREAGRLGAQIALVTSDTEVRQNARDLQIPVFATLKEAQRKTWRSRRTSGPLLRREDRPVDQPARLADLHRELHQPRVPWYERRHARPAFYAFSFLVLLAAAAALLPRAQITLHPAVRSQVLRVPVTASPDIQTLSFSGQQPSGQLPVEPASVIVEGRATLPTTGQVQVPQKAARGWVRLTNMTDTAIEVPERTVIASSGKTPVRFITTRAGTVPAGPGKSASLPVQALLPGETGNLPAGRLKIIEGPASLSLSAVNPSPLTGGSSLFVAGPSIQDYNRLYLMLFKTLRKTALAELQAGPPPGAQPLAPSLALVEVLEKTYLPEALSEDSLPPAEQITLTLRLEFEALVVQPDELLAFGSGVLDANLPEGFAGVPDTLEVSHRGSYHENGEGVYAWEMVVRRKIRASFNEAQAASLAAGLESDEAAYRLREALPLSSRPFVQVEPGWWPMLPLLPGRIEVQITGED